MEGLRPCVGLICVCCRNCSESESSFSQLKLEQNIEKYWGFLHMGANFSLFYLHSLTWLLEASLSTDQTWKVCKHCLIPHKAFATQQWFFFLLEQQAIWPIRWGPDLGSQIGRTGCWPGHQGYRPKIPKNEFLEDRGKQHEGSDDEILNLANSNQLYSFYILGIVVHNLI